MRSDDWSDAVRCCNCGLVYVCPLPAGLEDRLRENPPYREFPADSKPSRRAQLFFEEWESRVLRYASRGRLLDVGFGQGEFWRAASVAGWDAYGLDIHEAGVAAARDFWKTDRLVAGGIEDAPSLFKESFDVVNLSEVVEHLVDPLGGIRSAAHVLRPAGLLTIDVPNVRFAAGRLDRERVMGVVGHVTYWSSSSLRRAVETCGFRVVEIASGFGLASLMGRYLAPATAATVARQLRAVGDTGAGVHMIAELRPHDSPKDP